MSESVLVNRHGDTLRELNLGFSQQSTNCRHRVTIIEDQSSTSNVIPVQKYWSPFLLIFYFSFIRFSDMPETSVHRV